MGFEAVHSWTLGGLMEAFVDLGVAYLLLCISVFAFLPCKVLSVLGLCQPCPCGGTFRCKNSNLFLHKVLIDWPTAKISYVQELVKNRFPFDSIFFKDPSARLRVAEIGDRKSEIRATELEGGFSSSSFSGRRLQSSVDGESGYDAKGKRIVNQKQKSGIRRRKKAPIGVGKLSSASPSNTTLVGTGVKRPPLDGIDMRSEISVTFDPASGIEDSLQDDGNAHNGVDVLGSFEPNESLKKGEGVGKDSSFSENVTCNTEDSLGVVENNANTIRILEQALEEEKASHAALYQELEKERSAAASAADEAMAMILRLQEDKASIVMELRQYQRMIEETFNYDEEEMDILKEIIVRKERENHFLVMELEAYRQTNHSEYEQPEGNSSYNINHFGRHPEQIHSEKFIGKMVVNTNANSSNYEGSHKVTSGKQTMLKHEELASDLTSFGGLQQKASNNVERSGGGFGEVNEKEGKEILWNQVGGDAHSSSLYSESTIYDVHVIDDEPVSRKDGLEKESRPLNDVVVDSLVCSDEIMSDTPTSSMTETEPNANASYLDSQCKTLNVDFQGNCSSTVNNEMMKIDSEVEWLRERLRQVQEEKKKLTFSTDHSERVYAQLKLVEDMMNQLQEILQVREPVRQGSLPPSSSKMSLANRRCQSESSEAFECV